MPSIVKNNRWLVAIPALFVGIVAKAEGSLAPLKTVLKGWSKELVNVISIILAILALFYLVRIIVLMMKGEKSAAEQLLSWLIGFVGGMIVLQIVGAAINGIG